MRFGFVCLLLWSGACAIEAPPPHRVSPVRGVPTGAYVEELSPEELAAEPPPPAVADPQSFGGFADLEGGARVIERSPVVDGEHASSVPIHARRYVYRVRMTLPEELGVDRSDVAVPAAEFFVDVSADRLRARFTGSGWPVDPGSEVRIRRESPGSYVFDGLGGRSLAPGQLADWFEGGPRNRRGRPLAIRRDPQSSTAEEPGALVCALLAEWWGDPREGALRRCDGAAPVSFRIGFWRAERTAEISVELPGRALRADDGDPPPPIAAASSGVLLERSALSRVPPMERPPRELPPVASDPPSDGLEFVNESEARVIVTVEGVAVGWVNAGSRGHFLGLTPGVYRVAAVRPLGTVVIRPRVLQVPGRTILRASQRDEPR